MADAHSLLPDSLFVISSDGNLFRYVQNDKHPAASVYTDFGRPAAAPLSPLEGVVFPHRSDDGVVAGGSLFLRTEGGALAEMRVRANGEEIRPHWVDHGRPDDACSIASPPGAPINNRSLFVVCGDGRMVERYFGASAAAAGVWIDHGRPAGVPLAPVRGVALHARSVFFLRTDGLLAERLWNGVRWVWSVWDVPEDGTAKYCTPGHAAADSCLPSDKANGEQAMN